jgi:hypothetical protein
MFVCMRASVGLQDSFGSEIRHSRSEIQTLSPELRQVPGRFGVDVPLGKLQRDAKNRDGIRGAHPGQPVRGVPPALIFPASGFRVAVPRCTPFLVVKLLVRNSGRIAHVDVLMKLKNRIEYRPSLLRRYSSLCKAIRALYRPRLPTH